MISGQITLSRAVELLRQSDPTWILELEREYDMSRYFLTNMDTGDEEPIPDDMAKYILETYPLRSFDYGYRGKQYSEAWVYPEPKGGQ